MNSIESLKQNTINELNNIYDFKFDTMFAYGAFIKYEPDNSYYISYATHVAYKKSQLEPHYKHYMIHYLPSLSFQHNVNIFEAFFFDFLRVILTNNPQLIAPDKKIDVGKVLSISDRSKLIDFVVERELNELKYDRVDNWFKYLNRILQYAPATSEEIQHIAEIKASRDILVHNSGLVNAIYISKSGQMARYVEGEKLEITQEYFYETWELTRKLVQSMCDAALSKE